MRIQNFFTGALALCLMLAPLTNALAAGTSSDGAAVVFLLDASGSMQASDRDGAARDFISQLTHSFPTPFRVGFAAYSDDVTYVDGLDDREAVATAAEATKYAGYSNAGAGLNRAVELLSSAAADQKSVVLINVYTPHLPLTSVFARWVYYTPETAEKQIRHGGKAV